MGNQVGAHPLSGAPGKGILESAQRQTRALNGSEGDDHRPLATVRAGLRKRNDLFRAGRILHPNAGNAHPVIILRFGNDVENVALRHDHQTFPGVGLCSHSTGFARGYAHGFDKRRHGAVLIARKLAWRSPRLYRKRSLQLQHIEQLSARRCVTHIES